MSKFDQAKMVMQMRKIQKQLSKMVVEVDAGDGAVTVQMSGEQKVKGISLDPEKIDFEDIEELENWLQDAFREAISESQKAAAEKMKPFLGGGLGNLGL
jgi:nucleoid-associated protein EbfC